ncbi:MAG: histidine phosphatase family protein [Armatimonadetes bacterium]|nr:histidine phosphatase family protein [Armatimonadota bacterium]
MQNSDIPQTKIILIRHGQTAWNKEEIFRGRADVPLDEVGLRQAQALADALRAEPISGIFTSPLSRAVQTATAVAESRGLVPVPVHGFTDIDFGAWEGLAHNTVRERFPELYATWQAQPEDVTFPGGESLDAVCQRAGTALAELVQQSSGETIAVVAHRVVNKVLICHILGLPNSHFWQIRQDTAAINRFCVTSSSYIVDCLNDTCHLCQLDATPADF